ncbi:UMP kinase [Candidatus Berkelbacteria bacterium CG10_big_fil_rev_8_21_14_0_10_43_13]|uniref:Uridylate kinase n=1 Tax=Candidatus Berkelbacteria bacterium CG10_big_fil_rev_8_21_14_0_10_43_13 TaxID=1974514 RepID=A0A2H0W775_9BACT|nr:MAG: UMP kinase [Candidatus Berkelbacteria bacterium CG10_big_fil_rev_8_21_14_0_10_43_13]
MRYKRILLKLSGESLMGERSYGIDPDTCAFMASEIKKTVEVGAEIVVVLGGGNIFRGAAAEDKGMNRATGDYIGMLATVMNSLALGSALDKIGVENRVQSALEMPKVCEPYIYKRAIRHLEKGRVVIVAAGSGHPYFSTDTAAAVRACELNCDAVLKATKVDGVHDKDPEKNTETRKFDELTYLEVINNPEIKALDGTAITLCMENKLPVIVFELMREGNILKVVEGEKIGTVIK